MNEKDVQKAIVEALIWDVWMILRINQGGRHDGDRYIRFATWQALGIDQQDSGISDVIAMKDIDYTYTGDTGEHRVRTVLAIEVKAPGKKGNVTDKQRAFLDSFEEHGGIAIVADSLEDIEPYLDRVEAQ